MAFARARRHQLGTHGVSALEFALVAPVVLMTLFFTMEIGILMMTDATLTRVSGEISRSMQVYKSDAGVNCQQQIRQQLQHGMRPWVKDGFFVKQENRYTAGEQNVSATAALQCQELAPGELAVYAIGFERPGFTGILGSLGIRIMQFERRLLIQNELTHA